MVGKVYLVGAGPGDPGLITLRGMECLAQADLILYDGLVNPLILRHTGALAERTCRADTPDGQLLRQSEINDRLIAAALSGKTVVRLKGGDPFVFGRGGEEAAALAAAGVPFEVVPGVTAAVAASAYAGISLTHRDVASAVAFITGHEDPQKGEKYLDYRSLAAFPGTLVFYMGLHRLPAIVDALLQAGKPPGTPAAVISRGTTPAQQTVTAALEEIATAARRAELHAPSLIIIGACVLQREQMAWFEKRPLFGKRVGIARSVEQAGPQIARLVELGAQPVLMPTIRIEPPADWSAVDTALAHLSDYDWIVFTSANGVNSLLGRIWESGRDARQFARAKIAAIGEGTATALSACRLHADLVPPQFRTESLAAELAPHVAGRRVLWARASRGRDVLPNELRAAGARLDEVVVYQNLDVASFEPAVISDLERGGLDWVCLSSSSIARSFDRLLTPAARAHLGCRTRIASISPVTSTAARDVGLPVDAEADIHTWEGLFDAIIRAT